VKLRLLPEAEQDLEIGADFYESQRSGLAIYFNDCLASDIESLKLYGGIHEKYRGFFRVISKRFPFAIYYTLADDCVEIYAVLDCRQGPATIDAILNSPRTNRST
jgi:plasmid stabilization system protein ParE